MTEESVITQQMRDAVGVESEPITHDVERGAIIKFAQAIGDTNPLYNDEEVGAEDQVRRNYCAAHVYALLALEFSSCIQESLLCEPGRREPMGILPPGAPRRPHHSHDQTCGPV